MSRTINPWQFIDPYISYTPILAVEMNGKLTGISVTLKAITDELNQLTPRLPSGFTGNPVAADGPYHNTLLGIGPDGDVELVDRAAFSLLSGKDLTIVKTASAAFTVDGNSHANFYYCENNDADPDGVTAITVGEAIALVEGSPAIAPGTVIFFFQLSDTPLVFVEAPGVTIITPGLLKAYGQGSTVALVAIDQFTWVLVGDVYPATAIVE